MAKAHKNADFVLERPENEGSGGQKRTKTSILCSKCPKMRVPDPKSAQKWRFCARGWLPRAQQRCHEPCGVHLAAVRQATDCRNLPRNLPPCIPPARLSPRNLSPRPTCRSYYRAYRCSATAGHTAVYAAETYRQDLPAGAYYLALGPAPSGRVIRM